MKQLEEILESSNPCWEMFLALKPYFESTEDELFGLDFFQELLSRLLGKSRSPIENIRSGFVAPMWSCAVPSPKIIEEILPFSPIVEVGAGNGYWANLINQAGGEITAFDSGTDYQAKYFDVRNIKDADYSLFKNHTLLLIWPSDGLDWAFELLNTYNWNRLIYIGEGRGGRMASDRFFDFLEKNYLLEKVINMPRYPGWSDSFHVYNRKVNLESMGSSNEK